MALNYPSPVLFQFYKIHLGRISMPFLYGGKPQWSFQMELSRANSSDIWISQTMLEKMRKKEKNGFLRSPHILPAISPKAFRVPRLLWDTFIIEEWQLTFHLKPEWKTMISKPYVAQTRTTQAVNNFANSWYDVASVSRLFSFDRFGIDGHLWLFYIFFALDQLQLPSKSASNFRISWKTNPNWLINDIFLRNAFERLDNPLMFPRQAERATRQVT